MIKVDKIMKTGYNYVVRSSKEYITWEWRFLYGIAKVTSKGQVTIPIEIRRTWN